MAVCWKRKYKYGVIICHDGTVYKYSINHDIVKTREDMKEAIFHYNTIYKNYDKNKDSDLFLLQESQAKLNEKGIFLEKMKGANYERESDN